MEKYSNQILFFRICGRFPFDSEILPRIYRKILDVDFDFLDPHWDEVSNDGKNKNFHMDS